MRRNVKRVANVCHCVTNRSTRAWWCDCGAINEEAMISDAVSVLMKHGVGLVQLDCPEFSLYGNPRPARSRDEYDTPEFRRRCRENATQACDQMEKLFENSQDPKIELFAVVRVDNPPAAGSKGPSEPWMVRGLTHMVGGS